MYFFLKFSVYYFFFYVFYLISFSSVEHIGDWLNDQKISENKGEHVCSPVVWFIFIIIIIFIFLSNSLECGIYILKSEYPFMVCVNIGKVFWIIFFICILGKFAIFFAIQLWWRSSRIQKYFLRWIIVYCQFNSDLLFSKFVNNWRREAVPLIM